MSDNITLPREVAYEVPLHELLESVPLDARLVIDDADGKGTRFIPVGRACREAATALRAALAAPRLAVTVDPRLTPDEAAAISSALAAPKQEPVAFDFRKAFRRAFDLGQNYGIDAESDSRAAHKRADKYRQEFDALCADALAHAAPPTAAPEPTHPGYIIGSHWLETAYSRICAGEAEADVLRDYGLWRCANGIGPAIDAAMKGDKT
jgi:hypothetical protein